MTRIAKVTAIYIILALCGLGLCSDANGAIPDLIAHWEFDEETGDIAYDSAGDNDGTLVGDPCWTSGQIDGALLFDGDGDYVSLAENAVTTTEFTVAAWANHYGPGGGENNRNMIFCQRDDEIGDNRCVIYLASEGFDPVAFAGIRSSSGSYQSVTYPKKDYNEWHHYAMTVDSNAFILYIDGIEIDRTSNNQAGDYITSIDYVNIGRQRYTGVNNGFFNGTIDDVRIYDRAISAEEIEELYRGSLIGLEIEGPEKIAEDFQAQYKAIISYERTNMDVTGLADWSVEPNDIASITAGLLTTEVIDLPTDVTITAQYSEGDVNESAEKQVSIFAICPSGYALKFDGVDDFVRVPRSELLEPSEITVELWAFLESEQTSNTRLLRKAGHFGNGYFLAADQGNDRIMQLRVDNNGLVRAADVQPHLEYIGQWHHFAGVYTHTWASFYVDGSEVSTVSHNKGAMNHNPLTDLFIGHGAPSPDPSEHFKGKIDEVRIWNTARTGEQIRANIHLPLAENEPNLIAYWDFNEGEGQVAYDTSVNGNNGYLGSDPCGIDNSDPNWVDSDAPIGICTLEGLVERNLVNVLDSKLDILEQLGITMAKEEALLEMLNTSFKDRDFGTADKGDVVTAKQKIHSAIQHEQQSQETLEESIEKLGDALESLDIELYDDD